MKEDSETRFRTVFSAICLLLFFPCLVCLIYITVQSDTYLVAKVMMVFAVTLMAVDVVIIIIKRSRR